MVWVRKLSFKPSHPRVTEACATRSSVVPAYFFVHSYNVASDTPAWDWTVFQSPDSRRERSARSTVASQNARTCSGVSNVAVPPNQ